MQPALFLDRDGTININEPAYPHLPEHLKIYEGTVELIKEFKAKGYFIIVITNQSGIGRGYFTEAQMHIFNSLLKAELEKRGVSIDAIYYCPHIPKDNCDCRKPKVGLIKQALKDFDIDLAHSLVMGDRDDIDGEMARRIGLPCLLIHRE